MAEEQSIKALGLFIVKKLLFPPVTKLTVMKPASIAGDTRAINAKTKLGKVLYHLNKERAEKQ